MSFTFQSHIDHIVINHGSGSFGFLLKLLPAIIGNVGATMLHLQEKKQISKTGDGDKVRVQSPGSDR